MSFFKKLKNKLFKSSSKLEEGLDAIVEDGGEAEDIEVEVPDSSAAEAAEAEQRAQEEAKAAAEAEAARQAEEAEAARLAELQAARLAAEEARLAEEARQAEVARQAEEAKAAEEAARLAREAEEQRAEAARWAEEEAARIAEEARLAQEAQAKADAAAAQARAEAEAAEEARKEELARQVEAAEQAAQAAREAEAKRAEEARMAELEAARLAEEARLAAEAEAQRVAAEEAREAAREAEEARLAEEARIAEAKRQEEMDRAAEAARFEAEAKAKLAAEEAEQAAASEPEEPLRAASDDDAIAEATAALSATTTAEPDSKPGFFGRLIGRKEKKTVIRRVLDDDMLEALEELLIASDMGVETALRVTANMAEGRFGKKLSTDEIKSLLAGEIAAIMEPIARPMPLYPTKPQVVLVVGVNGSGKTTTIGKLASQFQAAGKKVVIAAGDTFRAAAVEQLQVWGDRAGVPVMTAPEGSDPASLAFDAMVKAQEDGADLLMIDTAGRLQNRSDLMEELAKIVRVIRKKDPDAPHNTLLVLDATTGQNALNQVDVFRQISDVSGLVMTKLDGTAKGGVLVALADKFGLPIHAIGVGEQLDDLAPFDPEEFAQALTGAES